MNERQAEDVIYQLKRLVDAVVELRRTVESINR